VKVIDAIPTGPTSCSFPIRFEEWKTGACIRCGQPRIRHARFLCWVCFDVTRDDDIDFIVNAYGHMDDDGSNEEEVP